MAEIEDRSRALHVRVRRHAQGNQAAKQRQGWFLTRNDARLLLVTFGGTVAANIATVLVVGLALAISRPSVSGRPSVGHVVGYLIAFVLIEPFNVYNFLVFRSAWKSGRQRWFAILVAVWCAFFAMFPIVILLVLLGWADGIK